ncbi:FtsX-like permease family protein [Clostridium rectalis]|uniref:FtsX-like permease family protein n=1 Tax=Clostridium rectalis TaxID=2040295 RepID=UPI001FA98166|nr:FtsX-like permease family protein [Clostridium rectalis]
MKKTNILWISDLSYRIKKNAHMLFLITIIFSAAFTTISSLYILNYNQDSRIITYFPFTISYLSLDKNIEEKNHVSIIENTLNNSNEKYNKCKLSIIKEEVMDEDYYIIKLADFNKILNTLKSNKIFLTPIKLNKNETYLISNYNKKHYIKTLLDKKSIWLKDNITLKVKGVSNRNIFPLGILSNSIVVEDSLYDSIKNNYSNITFYGYVVPEWKNNLSSISSLNNKIHRKYKDSFIFLTSSDVYEYDKFQSSLQLFIGFFIGAIFLIGAGSFLYFKFYVDINEDKNKYKNISKLGLTNNEIKTSITIQTFILFFVPYFISIFHTFFALKCLQGVLSYPIKIRFFFIWISFFIIHFIYFLKIRSKYIKKLLKYTI